MANLLPVLVVSKGDDAVDVYIEVTFREKLKLTTANGPIAWHAPWTSY